jgi:hypothetical protein
MFFSARNEYMRAISSIGSVLTPYDSDQKFPVRPLTSLLHLLGLMFLVSLPVLLGVCSGTL